MSRSRTRQRGLAAAVGMAVCLTSVNTVAQDSYYVNPGLNGLYDPLRAEFAPDLGGFVPFGAFETEGNFWFDSWTSGAPLRRVMLQNFTHLDELDLALANGTGVGSSVLFPLDLTPEEGYPKLVDAWWNETPGYLTVWRYRLHGGYLHIARQTTPEVRRDVHVMLMNMALHASDFGTAGWPEDDHYAETPVADYWIGDPGDPNLWPDMQALARGDFVVRVRELYGMDLWTALQRTQDAEHYLREEFIPDHYPELDDGDPVNGEYRRSYLFGGSWGAIVSGALGLLQPGVYAGSASTLSNDFGYAMIGGDWLNLLGHYGGSTTARGLTQFHSQRLLKEFYMMVDILGIRFDNPAPGMRPWDLGFLSLNQRPSGSLQIPLTGFISSEDTTTNWHWQQEDSVAHPNYRPQFIKNLSHNTNYGVTPGVNEFFPFSGVEWEGLIQSTDTWTRGPNIDLVPATSPQSPVSPRPYFHTLGRAPERTSVPAQFGLLQELDLQPQAPVRQIGQGTWIGTYDHARVLDLDHDGKLEVFFGNHDGFFHVLEVSGEDGDPTKLIDEYQSPPLGWGITAMAYRPAGNGRVLLGDGLGRIHLVRPTGNDEYVTRETPLADLAALTGDARYRGPIVALYQGDFVESNPGREIIALNYQLDWFVLSSKGELLYHYRRPLKAIGPGWCDVADVDDDGIDEVVVPALDGHVWYLDVGSVDVAVDMKELVPFTGFALKRAVAISRTGSTTPTHVLLFARDDSQSLADNDRVLVINLANGMTEVDISANLDFTRQISFDWLVTPGPEHATFMAAGHSRIQKFDLIWDLFGSASIEAGDTFSFDRGPRINAPEFEQSYPEITSLLDVGSVGDNHVLCYLRSDGRIFFLDDELKFLRTTAKVDDLITKDEALPWYSNFTFAHEAGFDLYEDAGGNAGLYLAEYAEKFLAPGGGLNQEYRVAGVQVDGTTPIWTPFVGIAPQRTEHASTARLTRYFEYGDFDGDGQPEPYAFAESGAAYFEDHLRRVRQFSNRTDDLSLFFSSPYRGLGGYVFEFMDEATNRYAILDDFFVPQDTENAVFDNGTGDWFFPRVGPNRITGQIAATEHCTISVYQGSSMQDVMLPDPLLGAGQQSRHLVTGTHGGYVYAISPGDLESPTGRVHSSLSYSSDDLGWSVVGMDSGDLWDHGDGVSEIAVGVWLDTGTFVDWQNDDATRNRAHVYILQPNPASGRFEIVADLTGDELLGQGRGLSSGVLGVKVDDVNGDGTPEIWCGDANGYLYLFHFVDNAWTCLYRSSAMGLYPGYYNNLFPVKGEDGTTERLVVVTPGYVRAFLVDSDVLPRR